MRRSMPVGSAVSSARFNIQYIDRHRPMNEPLRCCPACTMAAKGDGVNDKHSRPKACEGCNAETTWFLVRGSIPSGPC